MAKKIRKGVLAGQVGLFIIGGFLIAGAMAIYQQMISQRWMYNGPVPAVFGIPGALCIIVALALFSALRYEAKD